MLKAFGNCRPKTTVLCWSSLHFRSGLLRFFLFRQLKGIMNGTRFLGIVAVKMAVTKELRAILLRVHEGMAEEDSKMRQMSRELL